MSEFITETIVPGTYIEVRAEGLLTVGAISTGNVGVVGTAEMGGDRVEVLSSYEEGRNKFGAPGDWDPDPKNASGNLGLTRALKLLFDNGAQTVYARRVFDDASAKFARYTLVDDKKAELLVLRAKTPGEGGNRLQIRVEPGEESQNVSNEVVARSNGSFTLSAKPSANGDKAAVIGSVSVRENGLLTKYHLNQADPTSQTAQVVPDTRSLKFLTAPAKQAVITASYPVLAENVRKITLRQGKLQEVYFAPSVAYLAQQLKDESNPSKLIEVVELKAQGLPQTTTRFEAFSGGENGTVAGKDFSSALDELVDQNIQIVLVAGRGFSEIKSAVLAHVEKTENLGRERIAVIGADNSDPQKVLENANDIADKRVVLVAPGLKQQDPATGQMLTFPPSHAAAAVAGKLSSLAPHVSLTNKTLAGIDALDKDYNYGELKSLLQNRVLALQKKRGIRVVKGISTDDEAFKQITLRRIVDYVKEGTRLGANQYIGKLNNRRVRENLRTTLDSFLSDLLLREFLTGYKLTVFADRAMEIRGEVQIVMELNPTFSIDVIRVVMNLS